MTDAEKLSGPLDKGGASTSVFGQNGNRPAAAGNLFLTGHLSFLLSVNAYAYWKWKWKYVVMHYSIITVIIIHNTIY